ncbi:importin 4 [Homo sapiens]|uniref:Importin 4 n=1 Tax=Homo sapiens TaxID=9606 RepID=H0YKG5_HUMAN|nr:importin 4 [Homo sapiens]KAI4060281.1 importin 4 [Homo sapiens]
MESAGLEQLLRELLLPDTERIRRATEQLQIVLRAPAALPALCDLLASAADPQTTEHPLATAGGGATGEPQVPDPDGPAERNRALCEPQPGPALSHHFSKGRLGGLATAFAAASAQYPQPPQPRERDGAFAAKCGGDLPARGLPTPPPGASSASE